MSAISETYNRADNIFELAYILSYVSLTRSETELNSYKQSDLGQLYTIPSQTQTVILVIPFFSQKIYFKKDTM